MELERFISESLVSISKGIGDAIEQTESDLVQINPILDYSPNMEVVPIGNGKSCVVTTIEFDIAVSASTEVSSSAGGGIQVMSIKLGGEAGKDVTNTVASRIKFDLNISFPYSIPKPLRRDV